MRAPAAALGALLVLVVATATAQSSATHAAGARPAHRPRQYGERRSRHAREARRDRRYRLDAGDERHARRAPVTSKWPSGLGACRTVRVRAPVSRVARTGLTTAPRGSMQAEALTLAGGYNVIAAPPGFPGNLINVSVEDVLLAKPDVIVASDRHSPPPCAGSPAGATSRRSQTVACTSRPTYHSDGSTRRRRSIACSESSGSPAFSIPTCPRNRWRRG